MVAAVVAVGAAEGVAGGAFAGVASATVGVTSTGKLAGLTGGVAKSITAGRAGRALWTMATGGCPTANGAGVALCHDGFATAISNIPFGLGSTGCVAWITISCKAGESTRVAG